MTEQMMSDVEVVLKKEYEGREGEAVERLRGLGMKVIDVDEADGVVEGTIPTARLPAVKASECVAYVRKVFSYRASDHDLP